LICHCSVITRHLTNSSTTRCAAPRSPVRPFAAARLSRLRTARRRDHAALSIWRSGGFGRPASEHAERGGAQNRRGGIELAIIRAQYLREELARRSQNRQTRWIIFMTAAITVMTAFIMAAILWPPEVVRSAVHSLLIGASQVIDLWWPCG
jgi:hypothetical protein